MMIAVAVGDRIALDLRTRGRRSTRRGSARRRAPRRGSARAPPRRARPRRPRGRPAASTRAIRRRFGVRAWASSTRMLRPVPAGQRSEDSNDRPDRQTSRRSASTSRCICSISASAESKRRSPRIRSMNSQPQLAAVEVAVEVEQERLDEQPAAGDERRAHADRDRRRPLPHARDGRAAGVDAVVGDRERRVRDEVGGREAERAAALVAVGDDPAHPERRAQQPRGLGDRAGGDQPADVRRGDDLAVDLDHLDDPRRRTRPARAAAPRRPARGGRSGSSRRPRPSVAPSRSISSWSMNSCGVCACERAVERDHDQLVDAERGDQVGLLLERGQQLRRRLGRDHGARVRLEGQHAVGAADDLAVAGVHAVELAHREPARPRASRRGARSCSSAAEAYDGLERGAAAWLGEGDQAVLVAQAARCPWRGPGTATPWAALLGRVAARARRPAGTRARRRGRSGAPRRRRRRRSRRCACAAARRSRRRRGP